MALANTNHPDSASFNLIYKKSPIPLINQTNAFFYHELFSINS